MTFYNGKQFPAEYRGDIFAAEHGSWNRANRTGYKVIRVPLKNGKPTGEYEDFLTGFVTPDGEVWGRPVGVAVAPGRLAVRHRRWLRLHLAGLLGGCEIGAKCPPGAVSSRLARPAPPPRHKPGRPCPGTGAATAGDRPTSPSATPPLRHRLVARILEAHRNPGRHHQRRRHRRLLSQQVSAAPPRGVPERARSVRRTGASRARGRPGGAGPHGFQPRRRGFFPRASRLVRPRGFRRALSRRRQIHHLRQQPLLRRIPSRRAARDHRALAIPRASPTTVGAAWGATASATATTAPASSATSAGKPLPARAGLGRRGLPPVDRVELRAPPGNLGPQQPRHQGRRRAELPVDRHEQRLDHQPEPVLPRLRAKSASAPRSCCWTTRRATTTAGFQQNGDAGKLVHGLLGWDKLMPESMAHVPATAAPRSAWPAKPAPEARMWMIEGIAGGIQPWWHHVGRVSRGPARMYHTAEPVFRWHKEHEQYLVDRRPVASVGVVWSQQNTDYYGRDEAAELVDAPYRGFTQALIRARIPYLPVHADHIDRDADGLRRAGAAQCGRALRCAVRRHPPLRRARRRPGRHRRQPASTTNGATRGPISRWPICSARMRRPKASAARRGRHGAQLPAPGRGRSATPCCAASRRPISCPSAARSNPSAPIPGSPFR